MMDLAAMAIITTTAFGCFVTEWLCALQAEINLIWSKKWCLLTWCFLGTRYITLINVTLMMAMFHGRWSFQTCQTVYLAMPILAMLGVLCAEEICLIRIWSIWKRNRIIGALLISLICVVATVQGYAVSHYTILQDTEGRCIAAGRGLWLAAFWIAPAVLDAIVLLLAIIAVIRETREFGSNRLLYIILRDQFAYFLLVTIACSVSATLMTLQSAVLQSLNNPPAICVSSIAATRIVLSLKAEGHRMLPQSNSNSGPTDKAIKQSAATTGETSLLSHWARNFGTTSFKVRQWLHASPTIATTVSSSVNMSQTIPQFLPSSEAMSSAQRGAEQLVSLDIPSSNGYEGGGGSQARPVRESVRARKENVYLGPDPAVTNLLPNPPTRRPSVKGFMSKLPHWSRSWLGKRKSQEQEDTNLAGLHAVDSPHPLQEYHVTVEGDIGSSPPRRELLAPKGSRSYLFSRSVRDSISIGSSAPESATLVAHAEWGPSSDITMVASAGKGLRYSGLSDISPLKTTPPNNKFNTSPWMDKASTETLRSFPTMTQGRARTAPPPSRPASASSTTTSFFEIGAGAPMKKRKSTPLGFTSHEVNASQQRVRMGSGRSSNDGNGYQGEQRGRRRSQEVDGDVETLNSPIVSTRELGPQ